MSASPSEPLARIDYRSTYGYTSLIVLATGIGMVVFSRILPADELPRWLTPDRLAVLGALVIALSVHNFFQTKAFNANGHSIVIFPDRFEFNRVGLYRGRIERVPYAEITAVEIDRDEDDGGHVKLTTTRFSHRFDGEDCHPRDALFSVLLETLKMRAQNARFTDA